MKHVLLDREVESRRKETNAEQASDVLLKLVRRNYSGALSTQFENAAFDAGDSFCSFWMPGMRPLRAARNPLTDSASNEGLYCRRPDDVKNVESRDFPSRAGCVLARRRQPSRIVSPGTSAYHYVFDLQIGLSDRLQAEGPNAVAADNSEQEEDYQ